MYVWKTHHKKHNLKRAYPTGEQQIYPARQETSPKERGSILVHGVIVVGLIMTLGIALFRYAGEERLREKEQTQNIHLKNLVTSYVLEQAMAIEKRETEERAREGNRAIPDSSWSGREIVLAREEREDGVEVHGVATYERRYCSYHGRDEDLLTIVSVAETKMKADYSIPRTRIVGVFRRREGRIVFDHWEP